MFLVIWDEHSIGSDGGSLHVFYVQLFDVNGDPSVGECLVN